MSFTLQHLLYFYFAFLAVWAVFFLAGLYHMLKYGFKSLFSFFSTAVFVGGALLLLFASFCLISAGEGWNQTIWSVPDFNNAETGL